MHHRLVFVAALASAGFLACPGAAHADEPVPIGKPPTLSHFVQAEYPKDKHDAGITSRVLLSIEIGDDGVTVNAGPFRSPGLKARLTGDEHAGEFDLQTVMRGVVESVEVCAAPGDCYCVVFAKRRRGA